MQMNSEWMHIHVHGSRMACNGYMFHVLLADSECFHRNGLGCIPFQSQIVGMLIGSNGFRMDSKVCVCVCVLHT